MRKPLYTLVACMLAAVAHANASIAWPRLERLDLELDLSRPPEFAGAARMRLADIAGARVPLILNRALEPTGVRLADGREIDWSEERMPRSDYFKEARLLWLELGKPPDAGRAEIEVEYAGRGSDGSDGRDWRGLLLLADDELRMSEQTVFYPQFPVDLGGPAVQGAPGTLRVRAPVELEVAAPGDRTREEPGRWRFDLAGASTWSLVAARFTTREVAHGGGIVRFCVRAENEAALDLCEREALAALRFFAATFGPIASASLSVVEMRSRGPSYNWAAPGLITLESHALDDGEAVIPGLAHEIAHLWWGSAVDPRGPGERFLTESLAEYSSWRYLESRAGTDGEAARSDAMDSARRDWLTSVHETRTDPGMAAVRFATPGYSDLAYAKGPLVLCALEGQLGREAFDRALRGYAACGADGSATLAAFRVCLRAAAGREPDAPWLDQPGHAHVELRETAWSDGRLRGVLALDDCSVEIPALAPAELEIELRARGERHIERIALAGRETPFDIPFDEPVARVGIDPRGRALLASAAPAVLDAASLVSIDPAPDGLVPLPLGPFVLRLTFDRALAPPGARELEAIRAASFAALQDYFVPDIDAVRLAADGCTLELDVSGTLPGETHVVAVPDALADADGLPIRAARVSFRTAPVDPASRPHVVATEPANGARDVPIELGEVRITFSEPMRPGRGFKTSAIRANERQGHAYPPLEDRGWLDDRTLLWRIKGPLEPGRRYALPFGLLYRDLDGNPLVDFDLRFETASEQ